MNHIESCHNILRESSFFEEFKDLKILYNPSGSTVKSFKEFHSNINLVSKTVPKDERLNFLGNAWEFFSLFYMAYERNLICRNIDGEFKKFKIDDIKYNENDFGIDFFIIHNNETIPIQCKYNSDISVDLDPLKSKLDNFIKNSRVVTKSKYYILISARKLHYTIKELLNDHKQFYYISIEDMANDNIDIDFFESFYNAILNKSPKFEISEDINLIPLVNIEPIEQKVILGDYDLPIKSLPKLNNYLESKKSIIKNAICQFIILKYFKHLGQISYCTESENTYIISSLYEKTFVIKYFHTNQEKISSNSAHISNDINNMIDNFSGMEYDPALIYISNVSELYDLTLKHMTSGKIFSIINYTKLLTSEHFNNEFGKSIIHHI